MQFEVVVAIVLVGFLIFLSRKLMGNNKPAKETSAKPTNTKKVINT